jgi:hypothetical protein
MLRKSNLLSPTKKKPTFCEPLWREKQDHTHTDKLETGSGQPRRGGGNPWRWGGHCPPQRLPKLPVPAEVPKRNGIRGKCTSPFGGKSEPRFAAVRRVACTGESINVRYAFY